MTALGNRLIGMRLFLAGPRFGPARNSSVIHGDRVLYRKRSWSRPGG